MIEATGIVPFRAAQARRAVVRSDAAREAAQRITVLAEAATWLATPFHHMGRAKGAGVDCAQLVYMVYRAALPDRVPEMPLEHYAFTWNMSKRSAAAESYLTAVLAHAREIAAPMPGDLVLYRWGLAWAHGAIVDAPGWPAIVHASLEARQVLRDRGDQGRLARRLRRFFSLWEQPT